MTLTRGMTTNVKTSYSQRVALTRWCRKYFIIARFYLSDLLLGSVIDNLLLAHSVQFIAR